jgi:hypothetical protein
VDRREAGGVGEVGLGQRERKAGVASKADDAQPHEQLAEDMGDPGEGASPADRQYLLAVDGRVEQGREP